MSFLLILVFVWVYDSKKDIVTYYLVLSEMYLIPTTGNKIQSSAILYCSMETTSTALELGNTLQQKLLTIL